MSDIERVLTEDAERWQANLEVGPDLRTALNAARSVRGRRRSVLAAVAASIIVLLIASVAVVLARDGKNTEPAGGSGGYVGHTWRVVSLTDRGGDLAVPSDLNATITFNADGTFSADDSVNTLFGTYRRANAGYVVDKSGTSKVLGSQDSASPQFRVTRAVDEVMTQLGCTLSPLSKCAPRVVRAFISDNALSLRVSGYTLLLNRVGAAPRPSQSSSLPPAAEPFTGYNWRVVHLIDGQGQLEVPSDLKATITYRADGVLLADDSVNEVNAKYIGVTGGYVVRANSAGAEGYAGSADTPQARLFTAVDSVTSTSSCPTSSGRSCPTDVRATVSGDMLVLTTDSVTLTLARAGSVDGSPRTTGLTDAQRELAERVARKEASGSNPKRLGRSGGKAGTNWPSYVTEVSAIVTTAPVAGKYVGETSTAAGDVLVIRLRGTFAIETTGPSNNVATGDEETVVVSLASGQVTDFGVGNHGPHTARLPHPTVIFSR